VETTSTSWSTGCDPEEVSAHAIIDRLHSEGAPYVIARRSWRERSGQELNDPEDASMADLVVPFRARPRPGTGECSSHAGAVRRLPMSHCAAAHPEVAAIANELSDSLRLVLRHFPLAQVIRRPSALRGLPKQPQSWPFLEMASLLYENQEELDDHSLGRYARKAGLDLKRFQEGAELGRPCRAGACGLPGWCPSGVNGTPTFFINGKRYEGRSSPRRWWRRCSTNRGGAIDETSDPEPQNAIAASRNHAIRDPHEERRRANPPVIPLNAIRARCMQEGGLTKRLRELAIGRECDEEDRDRHQAFQRGRHATGLKPRASLADPERREKPGSQKSRMLYRGNEYVVDFMPKVRLEILVPNDLVNRVVKVIRSVARSTHLGDELGTILVFPVEGTHSVFSVATRSDEEGQKQQTCRGSGLASNRAQT